MILPALFLAGWAVAADLGGHPSPQEAEAAAAVPDRRATLEDLWRRRLLPPDQSNYSPEDLALLERMRRADEDGVAYLKTKPGGYRPWTVMLRVPGGMPRFLLTKEGYERYRGMLTQDAIVYFESKGGDAKWALKFTDWDGKRLFDPRGQLTEEGMAVYRRASLNLEVYWKGPNGQAYGTRRPPAAAK